MATWQSRGLRLLLCLLLDCWRAVFNVRLSSICKADSSRRIRGIRLPGVLPLVPPRFLSAAIGGTKHAEGGKVRERSVRAVENVDYLRAWTIVVEGVPHGFGQ